MAVSISDLQVLIEASVKAASAGQKSAAAGRLDERHFRRMDKLDRKNWKEFSFQFKTAVGSVNTTMRGYLDEIQKGGKDPDYDTIFADDSDQDIERGAAEIYSILASMVTGEALVVLRGVPNGQGWEAWSQLFNRFDPRTPAKSLMAMMAVMTAKKGQGHERADQRSGGLGGQGEESHDGARHRFGFTHQGGIVDRDVASRLAGLRVPVVGWEVHV